MITATPTDASHWRCTALWLQVVSAYVRGEATAADVLYHCGALSFCSRTQHYQSAQACSMSKTRLCRPSLLSSKPCRDYTAAASIRDLLQRVRMRMRLPCCRCKASRMLHLGVATKLMHLQDTSLPPDITDNLERCAAALEKAAVAAGAALPSAAQSRQLFAQKQPSKPQPARPAQPHVAAAADGVEAEQPKATAAGDAAQQGKRKKAKRKSEQAAAVAADAALDTSAQPVTAQLAGAPATDATEPPASQSGKKKHKKRQPASGTDATDSASAKRSSEQAAAASSAPGSAAAADVQTSAPSKKKRKQEAAAALEQQNGQAAHGSSVANAEQAVSGSVGKKHKKRRQQEPTD